jgi:predicted permease
MWASFVAWLRSKNITTHTIGAAIITFAVAYDSYPPLRNYIGGVFVGYPVFVTQVGQILTNIAMGVALWRNFSHSSSAAGTVAQARTIIASPDAPTAAEVQAATTKP